MSVNVGENGRRSVQVEVEVPGSPEEVWQAIATGPGISSWFVPTVVDERVGGATTSDFGMGMESTSTISEWNPPRSFTKDGDGMSPDAPPVATQWIIEAKSGGTCLVRVVHSWFASTDDWDGQWEMVEQGWGSFFKILRLKLQHFSGQLGATFDASGLFNGGESEAWAALTSPFGLTTAIVGQDAYSSSGSPALEGKVEDTGSFEAMLLTTVPGAGICHVSAMSMGEQTYLSIRFYLYGENASATVAKAQPKWSHWFAERFPMGG